MDRLEDCLSCVLTAIRAKAGTTLKRITSRAVSTLIDLTDKSANYRSSGFFFPEVGIVDSHEKCFQRNNGAKRSTIRRLAIAQSRSISSEHQRDLKGLSR